MISWEVPKLQKTKLLWFRTTLSSHPDLHIWLFWWGQGRTMSQGKQSQKMVVAVAVAFVVAVVVLAVAIPIGLCQLTSGSAMAENSSWELGRLEKALVVTNLSLMEARGHWDDCKRQLGVLEGKAAELERVLAVVTELKEENRGLRAEVAEQQKQLKDLQSSKDEVQQQNQLLERQLQDMRSQSSRGDQLTVPVILLTLLQTTLLM